MPFLLLVPVLHAEPIRAEVVLGNTRETTLDLWRPWPQAEKLLVPATLPDGSVELFLFDTGASTSVLSEEVAERLDLDPTEDQGFLAGLSGTVPWRRTRLPRLQLGAFELRGVDVAVGVPGVPEALGPFPVAGILGMNVWANFTCTVDYPRDSLELALPGEVRVRGGAPLLVRDGSAATLVELQVTAPDGRRTEGAVVLEVDTGAHDVLLVGPAGEPFRGASTEGEEPVLGIGANLDELPDSQLLRPTRRLRVTGIRAGGARLKVDLAASWLGSDDDASVSRAIPGLLGYTPLSDRRVVLDYPGERLKIAKSRGPARPFPAYAAWLEAHPAQPDGPARDVLARANVLWSSGERVAAAAEVAQAVPHHPGDTRLLSVHAGLLRMLGRPEEAVKVLAELDPAALAAEDEWAAHLGTLLLLGRVDDALTRARAAVDAAEATEGEARDQADFEEVWLGWSDALFAAGRFEEAAAALDRANAAGTRGGNGHLLRKARIAEALGDRYGAIVALRELMSIIPLRGQPFWWYALLAQGEDRATFLADLDRAVGRLHPGDAPLDFVGAALRVVGEEDRAQAALTAGEARDCTPLPAGADRLNCQAWYAALAGRDPATARQRIDAALAAEPGNSAFLDTAAMVALADGRVSEAARYAREAALASPADPYLLWQLSRIEDLARP